MSLSNVHGAIKEYGQVHAHSSVQDVTPHRIIQLLMEGVLEKMSKAKGYLERGQIEEKVNHIEWALSIIDGLRQSLDMEKGGDLARNLDELYDYMQRRLIEANMSNDAGIIEEVSSLMLEVKSAWDTLPREYQQVKPEDLDDAGNIMAKKV